MIPPDKLAAEMPKRRPSFRSQLSHTSRNSRLSDSSFTDREQLLGNTSQEIDDGKALNSQFPVDCCFLDEGKLLWIPF